MSARKPIAVAVAVVVGGVAAALLTPEPAPVPCEPFELTCRGPGVLKVHALLCGGVVKTNPFLALEPVPSQLHNCAAPDGGRFVILRPDGGSL